MVATVPQPILLRTVLVYAYPNVSQHTLYGVQHMIHINLSVIHCTFTAAPTQTKTSSHRD